MTGNRRAERSDSGHPGHPGGITHRSAGQILEGRFPDRVITKAVQRMMPGGPLSRQQLTHLRVYAGAEHPHAAQEPEVLDLKSKNPKNTRSE